MSTAFTSLGLPENPIMLAPLAGVSDHPFRRICEARGADLCYVEMLSAVALTYHSKKTMEMLYRHPSEKLLGVQVTSRTASEMGQAVAILNEFPFDTIDLNMGCPVKKVVKNGAGSGILKDPKRVYDTVREAVKNSDKPISAKIRLGWDHDSLNYLEVADAVQSGGASWLTIHGRTRSDTYHEAVNLEAIKQLKKSLSIPVIGNGNLFTIADVKLMREYTGVDGVMVSRGALGNPWLFDFVKQNQEDISLDEWFSTVLTHLEWQHEAYAETNFGMVCMRKHLLWYLKGWPGVKTMREQFTSMDSFEAIKEALYEYVESLKGQGALSRQSSQLQEESRFHWSPTYDMDRVLDRGVGEDCCP